MCSLILYYSNLRTKDKTCKLRNSFVRRKYDKRQIPVAFGGRGYVQTEHSVVVVFLLASCLFGRQSRSLPGLSRGVGIGEPPRRLRVGNGKPPRRLRVGKGARHLVHFIGLFQLTSESSGRPLS